MAPSVALGQTSATRLPVPRDRASGVAGRRPVDPHLPRCGGGRVQKRLRPGQWRRCRVGEVSHPSTLLQRQNEADGVSPRGTTCRQAPQDAGFKATDWPTPAALPFAVVVNGPEPAVVSAEFALIL